MKGVDMKNTLRIASIALLLSAASALAENSLYDDMGGKAGMDRLVDASVDRYLSDPRIKDIFDESNIDRIRAELKDQFCMVAEGPCEYKGHDMTVTHKGLHLTNANFNALVEDLQLAMDAQGISFPTQNRFLARLAPMQHQVVSK